MVKLTIDMVKCDLCNECVDSCTEKVLKRVDNEFKFDCENYACCAYREVYRVVCDKEAITVEEV